MDRPRQRRAPAIDEVLAESVTGLLLLVLALVAVWGRAYLQGVGALGVLGLVTAIAVLGGVTLAVARGR